MQNYFIETFKITKLWGYRDINLTFNRDMNVLIGPNGSGKTTILNILYSILSGDLQSILNIKFGQAKIRLKSFKGRSVRTIKVDITDELLKLKIGQKEHRFYTEILSGRRHIRRPVVYFYETENFVRNMPSTELTALVPLVWLPVSRRLPLTEDEEERSTRTEPLESVDLHFEELSKGLSRYHSGLNAQLSKRYRKFENQVLSVILYSKEYDQINSIPSYLPTEAEKDQLRRAFNAAGLLDEQMRSRINDHFAAAEETVKRISGSKTVALELEDILVLPLIIRMKNMVEYARELEEDREHIFAPLRLYEKTVNSFLDDKSISVDERGELEIKSVSGSNLNPHFLSSGEKQILILLTEALLRVDEPVVYIADEPELSLHVTWQEKLLESLVTLGGQKQIIVATHSPDIVGKFRDNVITLRKES